MSDKAATERRQADIAAKRAKLAELKAARAARTSQLSSANPSRPSSTLGLTGTGSRLGGDGNDSDRPPSSSGRTIRDKESINDFVSSLLLNNNNSRPASTTAGSARGAQSVAGDDEMQASTRRMSGGASGRTSRASEEANSSGGNASAPWSDRGNVDTQDIYTQTQAPTSLTSTSVEVYELAPRPKVTYDKSIQTSDIYPSASTSASIGTSTMYLSSDSTQNEAALNVNGGAGGAGRETHDELRARIIQELEEEKKRLDVEIEEEKRKADLELEEERARGLSQPALSSVLSSPPFLDFLSQSSKIVQRALSDSYDYLRDYTVSSVDDGKESDGARVRLLGTWNEESWGRGRSVTGVEWSPKFPELFVASYNRNPMAVNEPDGIACVWNLHLLDRPEFVFHSQSDVLSVAFTPFHPNLVVGGTYSGQILLWDTRSRHPNPVLKTPLSASGHTHPVYSLSMIGTQNAHNLISASTDGTVCAWTLDMLARPQETLSLIHPAHNKTDEVSVTAIGFQENETTTFWVGTEEGHVYAANRYDRAGAKAGLVQNEVFKAHLGPVTGMHFHPGSGPINFSDLFLTCGVDWTVRLWRSGGTSGSGSSSAKAGGGGGVGVGSGSTTGSAGQKVEISPLLSFEESDDYVYDVKWHPNHPAMFGSVDGAGKFDLWNLNVDTEVPIVSTAVAPSSSRGLNKLAWDRKEGRRAAIGSSDGKVYVYEVSQELVTPREGEWEQLRVTLGSSLAGGLDLAGR